MQSSFQRVRVTDIGSDIHLNCRCLHQILDVAHCGKVNAVVVADCDRICRFAFDLVQCLLRRCGLPDEKMGKMPTTRLADELVRRIRRMATPSHITVGNVANADSDPSPSKKRKTASMDEEEIERYWLPGLCRTIPARFSKSGHYALTDFGLTLMVKRWTDHAFLQFDDNGALKETTDTLP